MKRQSTSSGTAAPTYTVSLYPIQILLSYEKGLTGQDWTVPEVENLCTKDCVSSLDSWRSNVDKVCDEETTIQAGVIVKARALPLTFTYNADLVCTQDTESNWCFVDSQKWQGSDYIRYDPVMCFPNGDDNTTMAPECEDPDFDVDIISDEMAALTNLYGGDLVREPLNP